MYGMISVLHVARSSCRGTLFQALQKHSQISVKLRNPNFLAVQRINTNDLQCLSNFNTSHQISASSHAAHNHTPIWTAERFLSAGLVGLLPLSLAYPNPALDYALALALTAHVHWGVEAIVVDYIRPTVVGATLSKAAVAGVYALSMFTLGGLFYFNYSDVGLSQAIRMLWKL